MEMNFGPFLCMQIAVVLNFTFRFVNRNLCTYVISPATEMTATSSGVDDDSISERECHKGVKHLYETGIAKLPRKYVLPESDRPNFSKSPGEEPCRFKNSNIQLPLIDFSELQGSNRAQVIMTLANACENYGCFQVGSKLSFAMFSINFPFSLMCLIKNELRQ